MNIDYLAISFSCGLTIFADRISSEIGIIAVSVASEIYNILNTNTNTLITNEINSYKIY